MTKKETLLYHVELATTRARKIIAEAAGDPKGLVRALAAVERAEGVAMRHVDSSVSNTEIHSAFRGVRTRAIALHDEAQDERRSRLASDLRKAEEAAADARRERNVRARITR
jgi:hypothetical protein